ncbi:oxygenase [Lithospermum erythrorhizon]|uniref:Oxygenase n=1 Tax=Lithospermum erythrorhizon TaxID=34254 RepID=A0AAV3Q1T4_LITER
MDINPLQIVVAIILSFSLFQCLGALSRRRKRLPPGPFPLPLIGNLHLIGKKPHKSFANLSKTYGPIMSIQLGQVHTVVITSPALAKEVLKKQDLAFSSRYTPDAVHALDHYKYSAAWIPIGPRFRSLRKIMNTHMFSSTSLDSNQHLRLSKIQELIAYCTKYSQSGEPLHIRRAIFKTTLNLISNTIFSKDLTDPFADSEKDEEFHDLVTNIFDELGKANMVDFFPFLEKFDLQGIRGRMIVYFEKMLKIFGGLIDERVRQKLSMDGTEYHDMLKILLTLSEENPEDIDRKHIEHLCLDLFAAATDTTTVTVEWAMAEVLRSSRIKKKIEDELAQVIGRGKVVEEADIERLPYLSCVVKETFRLHPAGPTLIPRKAEQNVDIFGFRVPKGSRLLINAWAIGRDSSFFEDSDIYWPDRFLKSNIDVRGHDFELIPFGSGRRSCPGLPLAYRMVPVMLGSLLNSFEWKLQSGITQEQLDMVEKDGVVLQMEKPLQAIPIPL